jgi:hypothetical protein
LRDYAFFFLQFRLTTSEVGQQKYKTLEPKKTMLHQTPYKQLYTKFAPSTPFFIDRMNYKLKLQNKTPAQKAITMSTATGGFFGRQFFQKN